MKKIYENQEEGFTLIEILVTLVIFAIASAIAIGAFLNQRAKNIDKGIESETKAIALDIKDMLLRADVVGQSKGTITIEDDKGVTFTSPAQSKGKEFYINVGGTISEKPYKMKDSNTQVSFESNGSNYKIKVFNTKAKKYKSLSTAYLYNSERVEDTSVTGS